MRYRYRVLGTAQAIREDGTPVPLGGARLRALLTALALAGGRTVRTDSLAAGIWPGDGFGRAVTAAGTAGDAGAVPADETAALQALVARLRRALGREAIASDSGGYRLAADRDDIDLFRFERLAAEGTRALADGDPDKAVDLLDEALELWRGPAFADLPERGGATGVRAEASHHDAHRTRLAALLALGRARAALPALSELAAEHPLDEPLQALRLRALRDAGRPAEALEAYEAIRTELADRLGTDPGPELRALHAELLGAGGRRGAGAPTGAGVPTRAGDLAAGDLARAGRGPAAEPGVGTDAGTDTGADADTGAVAGAGAGAGGGTRPGGLAGDGVGGRGGPGAGQAARPRPVPGNLRARLTSFVGREEEMRALGDDLVAHRLVTLTGPGGSGKTRLSQETAAWVAGVAVGTGAAGGGGGAGADRPAAGGSSEGSGSEPGPGTGPASGSGSGSGPRSASGPGAVAASPSAGAGAEWPDGVWVAELAPVGGDAEVAEAVLTALGGRETVIRGSAAEGLRVVTDAGARDPLALLAERCATRRLLLVLDNCEHVIDAAAALAETLLVECPHVTVLATSREPLGVPGESVRPLEPLPDPVALRLLADRGAAAKPGFRVEDDPEACAEICRRLDGLPLAIELAAARLRALTPRQLADRLDDRFRLLTSGSRTVLPRQQTLRAVVDWSWELLSEAERAVLRRLSVFSGGCELAQAEEVCGDPPARTDVPGSAPGSPTDGDADASARTDDGSSPSAAADGDGADGSGGPAPSRLPPLVPPRDVTSLLGSLIDKSLVVAVPAGRGARMRYALLETVAEYAGERLDEVTEATGERDAVERRHLVAYRELARTTDPLLRGPDQLRHLDRIEREHDNIRAALRRALATGDEQEALCLVLSMAWFWQLREHRADSRTWATAVAAFSPDPFTEPVTPAPPVHQRFTDAPPPMPPELLDEARRAVHLLELNDFERDFSTLDDAERQQRLRAVTEVYSPGMPQTCRMPGLTWIFSWVVSGRLEGLEEMLATTVEACRRYGYEWELALALQMRSKMLNERGGRLDQASADCDESLEIFRGVGDCWGLAEALAARGEVRALRGDFISAAEDYRQAVACAGRLGAHSQVPQLTARLGAALVETGGPEAEAEGEAMMRQAMEETESVRGDAFNFAAVQYAMWLGRKGEPARALELLQRSRGQDEARMPGIFLRMFQGLVAWLLFLEGDFASSLAAVRTAVRTPIGQFAEHFASSLVTVPLLTAARTLCALGEPAVGARLIGAYDTHRSQAQGAVTDPVERESRALAEAEARAAFATTAPGSAPGPVPGPAALSGPRSSSGPGTSSGTGASAGATAAAPPGDEAYLRAYEEGARLSVEEATALVASGGPEDPPGPSGPAAFSGNPA